MKVHNYLETAPLSEITRYKSEGPAKDDCVSFSGAPRKHPHDPEKIILILDPFSSNTVFFEFRLEDIAFAEDLGRLATESGESLIMARVWVKKGSLGLKIQPFEVDEELTFLKDTEILRQGSAESDMGRPGFE